MKSRLIPLTLVPGLALAAVQAFAQAGTPSAPPAAVAAPNPPAVPAMQVVAAGPNTAAAAAVTVKATRLAAAGSVFYVMDGTVVHAVYAPVPPPALGFVYER